MEINDLTKEVTFTKTCSEIRHAIRERTSFLLETRVMYMKELQRELDGLSPQDTAEFFLKIFMDDRDTPAVLLARECINKVMDCDREGTYLSVIYKNLVDAPKTQYRISLEQAKRFGFPLVSLEAPVLSQVTHDRF